MSPADAGATAFRVVCGTHRGLAAGTLPTVSGRAAGGRAAPCATVTGMATARAAAQVAVGEAARIAAVAAATLATWLAAVSVATNMAVGDATPSPELAAINTRVAGDEAAPWATAAICSPGLIAPEAEVWVPLHLQGDPLGLWGPVGPWTKPCGPFSSGHPV